MVSPDEGCRLYGQVVALLLERPEPRKAFRQIGMQELIHALRLQQIPEPILPQVEE
jgi:hypothetical protein